VREAIFNLLANRVEGATVFDLYAGSGALGIEALSRGAAQATFVEATPAACQAIVQSLARTGFSAAGSVLRGRLPGAMAGLGQADLIFLDPPYNDEQAVETVIALPPHLLPGGLVVYEHGSRYNPPDRPGALRMFDRRLYGDSAIALYELEEDQ
jgi:16S rRNA (guanine966-N2)-methyltransferase